ncbi:response regulator [Desulfonatronovibrio magnus]|uniref:response regulator n=1 Tax=Desulfonatronovibrio magnus TaxID=698827 RepID=UPI0005EACE54|nr:response regulator [Desulfonatronovibrio magnus]RQD64529.1 MAG: response regulator [Desulfonatronovibrio sp. MSAO_Bac4]
MSQTQENTDTKRVEPDFFPPGSNVCFICLTEADTAKNLQTIFKEQGYLTTGAASVSTAVQKLRLNQYQCIVLEDRPDFKPIYDEIKTWPGNIRRDINLILIGSDAPSLHQQKAFIAGANFFINKGDLERMKELINQALKGYEDYYQPWNQAREVKNAH